MSQVDTDDLVNQHLRWAQDGYSSPMEAISNITQALVAMTLQIRAAVDAIERLREAVENRPSA